MQRNLAKLIRVQRGFTMTELLVVIAITGILLGLLFVPIIQGFNLTRKAQNQVQAQTQARNGLHQISRELSQAVFVFDNTTTPVMFPLKFAVNIGVGGAATTPYGYNWAGGVQVFPAPVLFSKVDFIPSGHLPSGGTKDPTTGDTIGGSDVRFPLAPGTRIVRYFIGLKDNTRPYENVYQRRVAQFSADGRHNPFVLYRVEFDPTDPKLINQANYNSMLPDAGGFNDPNFFYNPNLASNGVSYAANWKAIASAVVDGPNQDVVNWVKDDTGDLVLTTPFRPLVSFAPGAVTGDNATPGFMTAAAAEVPNAVPTIYSSQQGHWSLPSSVTFYRAASRVGSSDYGALRVTVDSELLPDGTTTPHVHLDTAATGGVLATSDAVLYCARITSTNEIFVKTPNLTFLLNMERGTIKTGFAPLAGDNTGVPLIRLANGTVRSMVPGGFPDANPGELVETLYRLNTRFPDADSDVNTPSNQGWGEINLLDDSTLRYFRADGSDIALTTPLLTTQAGTYTSPLVVFGNVGAGGLQPGGGLMLAAGSESVVGPDMSVTAGSSGLGNVTYYRAPGALTSVVKKATLITDPANSVRKRWTPIVGQRTYLLDQDTRINGTLPTAFLRFDNPGGPGLPARSFTDPAAVAEREVQVTYLWQNNYARRSGGADNGKPVDAQGRVLGDKAIIAPEPDVVKVDYATRDLLTVNVGALVYDSNTHQGTSINLTDKVRIGNTIR
ncbi:PulJ/GspJ family protein [Armatimonas rosea]|uniref:Prepilin-type N-terminal cleavage/methylation domain-containing protein n=1 Tax=Armatimonas rosea TaxID=685828 RepID=A0A7W9W3D7_ARMRO|nr:type II secretion system protein [Armatimonas rosea]MBB6048304.1 prepilin-type N-terminal cleavage/methylation domain-containing protein [Armatimonas rosea]